MQLTRDKLWTKIGEMIKELDWFLAPEDDHSELMLVSSLLRSLLPMKCVPRDSASGVLTWPLIQCRDGWSPE